METREVGNSLIVAYRDLLNVESRLGESLSPQGLRVGASLIDAWPVLQEYLDIYARGLSPAGVLILGGGPDEGSRVTGIPFTGAHEARSALGLAATGEAASPSAGAFWRAVGEAQAAAEGAPIESLFGTTHLALARPFDAPATREVRAACVLHVLRLLRETRPQVVIAVGTEALTTLGLALDDAAVCDFAATPESSWTAHYPAGSRLLAYPTADVPVPRPFRVRIVPVPALAGPDAAPGAEALASVLTAVWA